MTITDDEGLDTVEEVAERLQVKPSWVYVKVAAGELPGIKVGKYWRFRRSAIQDWLRQREQFDKASPSDRSPKKTRQAR